MNHRLTPTSLILLLSISFSSMAQSIVFEDLDFDEVCVGFETEKSTRFFSTHNFAPNNFFKVRLVGLNQYTDSVFITIDSIAFNISSDTLLFVIPDSLDINNSLDGDGYVVQMISSSPADTSNYSTFFNEVGLPDNLTFTNNYLLCVGDESITLEPNFTEKYNWYQSNQINTIPAPIINTSTSGNYRYQVSEVNACGEGDRLDIYVQVLESPTSVPVITSSHTVIEKGQYVTLKNTSPCVNANTYWSNGMTSDSITLQLDTLNTFYAVCDNGICSSPISNELTIDVNNSSYCIPKAANSDSYNINAKTLSLNNMNLSGYEGGYQLISTEATINSNSSMRIKFQTESKEYSQTLYIGAWMDINRNGSYEDNELIFKDLSGINSEKVLDSLFNLPTFSQNGVSRIRFVTVSSAVELMSCPTSLFSKTYDYSVNLVGTPCPENVALSSPNDDLLNETGTFKSKTYINANNSITNNSIATFEAGNYVLLTSGFEASSSSVLSIVIKSGCIE